MNESTSDRRCVIVRHFDAPVRLVFKCYSEPEQLLQWFGPGNYPLTHCTMDFRVGGEIEMMMTGPDGPTPKFGGKYLEIEQDRRIVYTNQFLHERGTEDPMVVTLSFEEADGGTKLTVDTLFATVEQARRHMDMGYEGGVGVGLDQLAAYLPKLRGDA